MEGEGEGEVGGSGSMACIHVYGHDASQQQRHVYMCMSMMHHTATTACITCMRMMHRSNHGMYHVHEHDVSQQLCSSTHIHIDIDMHITRTSHMRMSLTVVRDTHVVNV